MSLFSGFSGAFIAGGLGEFNKIQEQKKIAEYEKDKQVRQDILARRAKEDEMVFDLVKLQTEQEVEQQAKRDEFNANNRRAYDDLNVQIGMYREQGLTFGLDYGAFVDKDNNVQIEMYEPELKNSIVGFTADEAKERFEAFSTANADIITNQGLIAIQELNLLRKDEKGVQRFTQGLSLKPLPTNFGSIADALAAIEKAYEDKNVKALYDLMPKLLTNGRYGIEVALKTEKPKTFDQMLAGIPAVTKLYTDDDGNELYDAFVAGKPGEHYYEFKRKIPLSFQTQDEVTDYIKKIEDKSNNTLKGLFSFKDGQYDVSFVEAKAKLFETQEEAQDAADKASKDNPNYVYAVIGSNSTGWSIKADKKDKDKPDPSKDASIYDQENQAPYNFAYFVRHFTGDYKTTIKGQSVRVIPLTSKINNLQKTFGSGMKTMNKDDYMFYVLPDRINNLGEVRGELEKFRVGMPVDKVKRLFDENGDVPEKLRKAGQIEFIKLFGTLVKQIEDFSKQTLTDSVVYENPAEIASLKDYADIDPRIAETSEGVINASVRQAQENNPGGVIGSSTTSSTNSAGQVTLSFEEYPNLRGTAYVDNNGVQTPDFANKVQFYSTKGGMISPDGSPRNSEVLSLFNNAIDVNEVEGEDGVTDAISSLDNLIGFFANQQFQTTSTRGFTKFAVPNLQSNLKEAYALYLSPFSTQNERGELIPDHTSRMVATQVAIPDEVVKKARGNPRNSTSTTFLNQVTGYESPESIRVDLATVDTGLRQAKELKALLEADAEVGLPGEVRRLKSAVEYIFANILNPFVAEDAGTEADRRRASRFEAEYNQLNLGNETDNQALRLQKNALAKYITTNLVYIQAKINDPKGRLSEGDREQASEALANYAATASVTSLKATAEYLIEQAQFQREYLNAIRSPNKRKVIAAEYYRQNYIAGRPQRIIDFFSENPTIADTDDLGTQPPNETQELLDSIEDRPTDPAVNNEPNDGGVDL